MAVNTNKAGQTHDQLQAACYLWACQTYHPWARGRLIAVPNDASGGNAVRAKRYQALGVTPGVWDMEFFWFAVQDTHAELYSTNYRIIPAVYFWEIKVGADKLSVAQKNFRDALIPMDYKFFVASELDEFQSQFKSIIEPTAHIAKQILKNGVIT